MGLGGGIRGRIASNCLWPRTVIDTAAVRNLLGGESVARRARRPSVMADAAWQVLTAPPSLSGWFCLDDLVLAAAGEEDFARYAVDPASDLIEDFFLPAGTPQPPEADGAIGWRAPAMPAVAAP